MPSASTRSLWNGAISFGLVHIPIELRSATQVSRAAFKWIDTESASAVGNQQISKRTGEPVDPDHVVKGIEVEDGQFVTLSKEEIRAALPKSTQSIEIEAFVDAGDIPPAFYDRPYHVVPSGKGLKAYALLRATLLKTNKVGLARVVISTKQHLAALMPIEGVMMLNLLRWADEVRSTEGLPIPDESIKITASEVKMAEMLVKELTTEWAPDLFHDEFKEKVSALVEAKTKAGNTLAIVEPNEDEALANPSADVLDITELLKKSLQRGSSASATPTKSSAKDKVTPLKRAAATKKASAKSASSSSPTKPARKAS